MTYTSDPSQRPIPLGTRIVRGLAKRPVLGTYIKRHPHIAPLPHPAPNPFNKRERPS